MEGRNVYVVFQKIDDEWSYVICQEAGLHTGPGGDKLRNEYGELSQFKNSLGAEVYMLDVHPIKSSAIVECDSDGGGWYIRTTNLVWQAGKRYGLEAHPRAFLPPFKGFFSRC